MREHVCARCGDFLLLFPAENITFIEPVPGHMRFASWLRRDRTATAEAVLDLRRLLDVPNPLPPESGVILRWRATGQSAGSARQLSLLVDNVEEIVNCYAGDLIDVPILPRRLRPLCDQVMRDPSGRLRLRVKPDVRLPLERFADRRRFAVSLLTTGPTKALPAPTQRPASVPTTRHATVPTQRPNAAPTDRPPPVPTKRPPSLPTKALTMRPPSLLPKGPTKGSK